MAGFAIDVVSDAVCPWCYIGKRHLEAALQQLEERGDPMPEVRWHPFQLNPDLPREGVPRREYLERKFGGPARAAEIYERVRRAGTQAGIAFQFERIDRQPNTLDAHRLVAWVQATRPAEPLVERLFRAYFIEGRFIGDRKLLADLAAEDGSDRDETLAFLESGHGETEIAEADERARSLGVQGVPFFIVDGRIALSGAQPPEVLLRAIDASRERAAA